MAKNLSISNTWCCSWFTPRLLEIQRMKNTRCTVASCKAQRKCFVFFMHGSTISLSSAVKILAAVLITKCAAKLTTAFFLCSSLDTVGGSYLIWFPEKLDYISREFVLRWNRLSQNLYVFCCVGVCVCVWGLGYYAFVRTLWTPELCISRSKKEWRRAWAEEKRRKRWQL